MLQSDWLEGDTKQSVRTVEEIGRLGGNAERNFGEDELQNMCHISFLLLSQQITISLAT